MLYKGEGGGQNYDRSKVYCVYVCTYEGAVYKLTRGGIVIKISVCIYIYML